jgi:hypothetical protein
MIGRGQFTVPCLALSCVIPLGNFGCERLLLSVYWMSLRNGWFGKTNKNCLLDGVMIGRGHFTVPCLALSYVERAFFLLIYIFFHLKEKKSNFEKLKIVSFHSIPISPPNLSLPLSISSPQPHREPATIDHSRARHYAFSIFGQNPTTVRSPSSAVFHRATTEPGPPVPAIISSLDLPHFWHWYRSPPFFFLSCFRICLF